MYCEAIEKLKEDLMIKTLYIELERHLFWNRFGNVKWA